MHIDGLGRVYIRPLRYFEQVEFFDHRPDNARTAAAILRRAIVAPGFEDCSRRDVQQFYPQATHALIRAVNEASAPESPSDDADDADAMLSDRIHSLHELDYTFPDLYGLLPREIELAADGARRAAERREDGTATSTADDAQAVESTEGTQMRGGPADGVDRIDLVGPDGDVLAN